MDRGRTGGVRGVANVIVVCLLLLGAFTGFSRQGSPHAETDLSQISGVQGEGWDINGHGQVVGILGSGTSSRGFLVNPLDVNLDGRLEWFWNRTGTGTGNDLMQGLGTLGAGPGAWSEADSINSYGQIAGTSRTLIMDHAYIIDPLDTDNDSIPDTWFVDSPPIDGVNDLMIDLGSPGPFIHTWCWDSNDASMVVGCFVRVAAPLQPKYEACIWTPAGGWVGLGTLGGPNSTAYVVGETGVVVGYADYIDGKRHAFVIEPEWVNGSYSWYRDTTPTDGINDLMFDLGSAGGSSEANCVNSAPTVVGWCDEPVGGLQAVIWQKSGGVWTRHTLWPGGMATAINELGTIVGQRAGLPVMRDDTLGMHDLDSGGYGKPWWINNIGQVVGTWEVGSSGKRPAIWAPHLQPWAVFTFEPITGLIVQFNASLSKAWDGTIVSYDWDFDDGTTGVGVTPVHEFASGGTYNVSMTVTNDDGLSQTLTQTVNVVPPNVPPVANIVTTVIGMTVEANASMSYDPDGTIVAYLWNFGDGASATGVVVSHTYAVSGTYTIDLTVSDDDHAISYAGYDVTVGSPNTPPIAGMVVIVTDMSVFVDASPPASYDPGGTVVAYYWDFGDGTNTNGMLLFHTYAAEGTYTINLTVMDNEGAFGFAERVVNISATNLQPIASWSETMTGLSVSFNASASYDPDGSIASYSWWFDDGSPLESGAIVSHTYSVAGTYLVELMVTDNEGLRGWLNKSVTVSAAPVGPVADFTVNIDGLSVEFDASVLSYDPDGTIVSYSWYFDDGSPNGSGENVSHAYSAEGTYYVSLTVIDNDGYGAVATKPVTIALPDVPPVAGFSAVPTYLSVAFDASFPNSHDSDGWIVSYDWDFGDYSTGTGATVVHDYWIAGNYSVTLTVTDNDGLTDSVTSVVKAVEPPLPEVEGAIADIEVMITEAHNATGQPIDNRTMDSLMLRMDVAMRVIGIRKTSGSPNAVEIRKTSGANLLFVFDGMVETYTFVGKLAGDDGWNMTCESNEIISMLLNQTRIKDVPNFKWYHGCGATAAGMVIAYWDAHGFDGLVKGQSGLLQTPEVNDMIASPEHIAEYALYPDGMTDDSMGPIVPDLSEQGSHHPDNCLADYMRTSQSVLKLGYGMSYVSMVVDGLEEYTANAPRLTGSDAQYVGYCKELTGKSFKWSDLKAQVDSNHPLVVTVDYNGDGDTDHLVTVVGYCEGGSVKLYAFHSTWDNTIYWGCFEPMRKGTCYGIYSGFVFDIVEVLPPTG